MLKHKSIWPIQDIILKDKVLGVFFTSLWLQPPMTWCPKGPTRPAGACSESGAAG